MFDSLKNYLITQLEIINNSLDSSIKNFDYNAIHDFRISTKKLRYIFELLDYNRRSYDKLKKYFKKNLKKIINKLGKVRELQVSLNLLENYEKDYSIDLSIFITELQDKLYKKHSKVLSEYNSTDEIKNDFNHFLNELISKIEKHHNKVIKYFLTNLNKLIKEIQQPENDIVKLHEFRMKIKSLRYAFEVIADSEYKNLIDDISRKIEVLKNYEVLLGNWHDNVVLLNYLKKYVNKNNEKRYFQFLQLNSFIRMLSTNMERTQNELFKKINDDSDLKSIYSTEIIFY